MRSNKSVKTSVALAILKDDDPKKILQILRPEDDAELPGLWGLPAASCCDGESIDEAAGRVGLQKLGCRLKVGRRLAEGSQERPCYTLRMVLMGAVLVGKPQLPVRKKGASVTLYSDWRWEAPSALEQSARSGSLCSELLLKAISGS